MTVKELIEKLQEIENKDLDIELVFDDWEYYKYYSRYIRIYDDSEYNWTVRITNY